MVCLRSVGVVVASLGLFTAASCGDAPSKRTVRASDEAGAGGEGAASLVVSGAAGQAGFPSGLGGMPDGGGGVPEATGGVPEATGGVPNPAGGEGGMVTAIGGADQVGGVGGEAAGAGGAPAVALYATCADIKVAQPAAADGPYTLHYQSDPAQPWTAYCANMASAPIEYLTLTQVGAGINFSRYAAGGSSPGTNVDTHYTRVRLNPTTLVIDANDQLFSSSTGSLTHPGNQVVTTMPYGIAMGCGATGVGNVNLSGTPFAFRPGDFYPFGNGATGSATYSSDNRVIALSGTGSCGWVGAVGAFNPFNQSGTSIQLVYSAL